jgi:ADP-ribosylglycohydrolase
MDASRDAALGCVLGAAVGDAAGGVLEFLRRAPTEEEVRGGRRGPCGNTGWKGRAWS